MGGLAFIRRLPRWARRLWYAILLVTAIELALFGATLLWAPGWIWLATELFSLSAWPLGAGVLLVVIVGGFSGRRREPAAVRDSPAAPQPPAEHKPPAQRPEGGIEVAAGRGAARLLAQAARRPEGQAAIRRTGRLARAVRAATRPPEQDGDQPRS